MSREWRLYLLWGALQLALAAACAGLLGIEERSLDNEAELPEQGYEGCEPGVDCSRCLFPTHESLCLEGFEAPSVCENLVVLDQCTRCACGECQSEIDTCLEDPSCEAIWSCINSTRCELSDTAPGEASPDHCLRADQCQDVIRDNGGINGSALQAAARIRACAAGQSCLSCLPAEPEPAPDCNAGNCQACNTCIRQCLCTDESYSACNELCNGPEACSSDDDCEGCTTCLEACSCNGGSFAECTATCQATCVPGTACDDCGSCVEECECLGNGTTEDCTASCQSSCNDNDGCAGCADCVSECLCQGNSHATCQESCPEPEPSGCKLPADGADGQCGSCSGCLAKCTCRGNDAFGCAESCSIPVCDDATCRTCTETGTRCVCPAETARECVENNDAAAIGCSDNECNACACESCPTEVALCSETSGCPEVWECMETEQCGTFADCASACPRPTPGIIPIGDEAVPEDRFQQVLEALVACTNGHECPDCY